MSLSSDPKFKNYMKLWEVKTNEAGTRVSGRGSTGRKATKFDKFTKEGEYVNSSWFLDFVNTDEAKKLKKGDNIIVLKFSITSGEQYAEGKYSPTKLTIWEFEWNDSAKGSKTSAKKTAKREEAEDDDPF